MKEGKREREREGGGDAAESKTALLKPVCPQYFFFKSSSFKALFQQHFLKSTKVECGG